MFTPPKRVKRMLVDVSMPEIWSTSLALSGSKTIWVPTTEK